MNRRKCAQWLPERSESAQNLPRAAPHRRDVAPRRLVRVTTPWQVRPICVCLQTSRHPSTRPAIATHLEHRAAFPPEYVAALGPQIRACRQFTQNNLNRDFVGTRGFSIACHATARQRVAAEFPCFLPYLDRVLRPDCNAFYLNPLELQSGSRVDPHIDRSLRAYCNDINTPHVVSVLYVEVPTNLRGGRLVLARGKRLLARVVPEPNLLVEFDGDLTHSVERLDSVGKRLSLVCEQYALLPDELEQVPEFAIESRANY